MQRRIAGKHEGQRGDVAVLESLERRELLSGNMTALNAGGAFYLYGDASNNTVVITNPSAGTFTLTGTGGTTINGLASTSISGVTGPTILTMGGGGDTVHFQGCTLPGALTFYGGVGANVLQIDTATSQINGALSVFDSVGNDTITVANTTITGAVYIDGSLGTNTTSFASSSVGGSFTLTSATGTNSLTLTSTPVTSYLYVYNGPGGATTTVTGSNIGSYASITDASGAGTTSITGSAVTGALSVYGVGGAQNDTLGASGAAVSAASLSVTMGDSANTLTIRNLTVAGVSTVSGGIGGNTLWIDDSTFTGATTLITGGGTDAINIERLTGTSAQSLFTGFLTMSVGAGDDTVAIGNSAGGATSRAQFHNSFFLDGGPGNDTLNFWTNANILDAGAPLPTILNVENGATAVPLVTTTTATSLQYNAPVKGTAVVVDNGLTVIDPSTLTLASATVSIVTNFVVGQDVLGFTNQSGIVGSWNAATGVLTLTGSATIAQYQAALRSVTYTDTAATPTQSTRQVSFVVSDGTTPSIAKFRSVIVDVTVPSVTINVASGQANPTNGSPILFTVAFSESVTGFTPAGITLSGTAGATTAFVSGSGTTWTVQVSGMTTSGTVIATVNAGAAADAGGNASTASTSTNNTVNYVFGPSVTINDAASQANPTNASPVHFTVVFSSTVTGFSATGVTLSGTAGATTAVVTGSGSTYDIAVSGMTGTGTVIATVKAGAAFDSTGHANLVSTSTNNTINYDVTPPSSTVVVAAGQANPTNASPINFTVTFSESVNGLTGAGVSVSGTAGATTAVVTGSGTTYNVAVSGMTGTGTVTLTVNAGAAMDAAGNVSLASTGASNTVNYDITPAIVTINNAAVQANPTKTSPINFSVVFSKAVTGLTSAGVTLSGTAPGTLVAAVTGSGTTWNVAVSGMTGSGTVTATVKAGAAHDAAGNATLASTSTLNTVNYDITPPAVTINNAASQASPTSASPINFTVVFTESVTGFTNSGVTIGGTAGATTAVVTGSGTTWNVAVSGMTATGTVTATVKAGAAVDAAGNSSLASTSTVNTVSYVMPTSPSVTINSAAAQSNPTIATPINFTVVFSTAVTGFTGTGVVLTGTAGATTAVVTGSGTTYNVAVSGMTAPGTVIATVAAGAAQDSGGHANTASTSTLNTVYFDFAPPAVVIAPAGSQANPANGTPINFTVVFSVPVTGFSASGVSLSGTAGATTAVVTGSGTTYNVAVSGMTSAGTVIVGVNPVAAFDAAGNASLASPAPATVTYNLNVVGFPGQTTTDITYSNNPAGVTIGGVQFRYSNFGNAAATASADSTGIHGSTYGLLVLTFTGQHTNLTLNYDLLGATGSLADSAMVMFSSGGFIGDIVTVPGTYNAGTITVSQNFTYTGTFDQVYIYFSRGATSFDLTGVTFN